MKVVSSLQDRAAAFIGVSPDDRRNLIEDMLRRSTADVVGYWLQLILSMGIATLGLAMGSTAVVIGAMLISPLMGPLVELGAGLATGSLILSFRAGVRATGSVLVVVLGAAGVTWLLPFHEITAELAARTSPTMLDLFVAGFCALAAVYTTVRQGKDVMSAAAGTAIGISLVPPLCTAGYGLGISNDEVFRGALLLFTANFAAISAVTAIILLLLGYGQVHVGEIEDDVLAAPGERRLSHRAARLTRRAVGRRLGVLRLLIPAVLLGAIILPLKRALEEVSWQVRVRSEVEDLVATIPGAVVRQSLDVRNGSVRVRLLLVGSDADAQLVAADLRTKLAAIGGSEPVVEVIAVPDAATLDAMASQLQAAVAVAPVAAPPPPPRTAPAAKSFVVALEQAKVRHWPAAAGEILRLRASTDAAAPDALELEVTHLGPSLGVAGEQLLEQAWSAELEVRVDVLDRAVPTAAIDATVVGGAQWLTDVVRILDLVVGVEQLHVCITVPTPTPASPPDRRRRVPRDTAVPAHAPSIDVVRAVVESLASGRPDVSVATGTGWSVLVVRGPCVLGEAPAEPGTP